MTQRTERTNGEQNPLHLISISHKKFSITFRYCQTRTLFDEICESLKNLIFVFFPLRRPKSIGKHACKLEIYTLEKIVGPPFFLTKKTLCPSFFYKKNSWPLLFITQKTFCPSQCYPSAKSRPSFRNTPLLERLGYKINIEAELIKFKQIIHCVTRSESS